MIFPARQESARYVAMAAALVVMAALLFARLGHNALWDDETMVGLAAKGVVRTGDTSVMMDHGNVVAYRGGILVRDFSDRSTPPLATYLTAASFSLFGVNAWTARLPFAIFGLATVVLILSWARRESWPALLVLIAGLLGNVSLILFFRQCRYFGPTIFFTVAIAFVYWRWKPGARNLLILAGLSVLLFASNYMNYFALYLCLAVDYMIWKRREWPPTWFKGLLLFGPQLILNGAVACLWNPLRTHEIQYEAMNSLWDRLTLFLWYWRDMDYCEFFALPLLLVVLILGITQRQSWLVRGCLALFVYTAFITVASPQPVHLTSVADVRYLAPMIPVAVALEVGVICLLLQRQALLAVAAALVAFGTNLLHLQSLVENGFRSTILCYVGELLHPPPEPYTPAAQWINDHVPEGDSVWVLPDYATYPLMFQAPRALYAWQLSWPPRPDFADLPRIHFLGQEPPDYLVAFGPGLNEMAQALQQWNRPDVHYEHLATIPTFWKDLYRPELFWHTFVPITTFDPDTQAIYIFRRTQPPIAAHQNSLPK
jgi:hypothetical protein